MTDKNENAIDNEMIEPSACELQQLESQNNNGLDEDQVAQDNLDSVEDNTASHADKSVIASVEYIHGRRRTTITIDELTNLKRDASRMVWVGLKNPSFDELKKVCSNLGISDQAQEEISIKHKKPKMIDYGDYAHIVAITMHKGKNKISFGELQLIFGTGFILTVRRGSAITISALRSRLEAFPELIARGSDYVVAEIMDLVADSYVAMASKLEGAVDSTEQRMMLEEGFEEADVRSLYTQRRDLLRAHTAMAPMIEICRKLSVVRINCIEADSRAYFSIVSDRIARVDEQINSLREALAFAFEASMMIGQSQQTDITKKLASWAAILAVPTAIAGIYGMNFEYMPEIHWVWGYPLVMIFMFGVCALFYWRFKKSGWL